MSERYYITGVQLGMLKAFLGLEKIDCAEAVLDEIVDKQFVGDINVTEKKK